MGGTRIFDQDFVDELFACPSKFLEEMGVDPRTPGLVEAIEQLRDSEDGPDIMAALAKWKPKKNSSGNVELIFP
jgi:hypothetical protein